MQIGQAGLHAAKTCVITVLLALVIVLQPTPGAAVLSRSNADSDQEHDEEDRHGASAQPDSRKRDEADELPGLAFYDLRQERWHRAEARLRHAEAALANVPTEKRETTPDSGRAAEVLLEEADVSNHAADDPDARRKHTAATATASVATAAQAVGKISWPIAQAAAPASRSHRAARNALDQIASPVADPADQNSKVVGTSGHTAQSVQEAGEGDDDVGDAVTTSVVDFAVDTVDASVKQAGVASATPISVSPIAASGHVASSEIPTLSLQTTRAPSQTWQVRSAAKRKPQDFFKTANLLVAITVMVFLIGMVLLFFWFLAMKFGFCPTRLVVKKRNDRKPYLPPVEQMRRQRESQRNALGLSTDSIPAAPAEAENGNSPSSASEEEVTRELDLDLEFQQASDMENERLQEVFTTLTNEEKLHVYAMYKQASEGDCTGDRPGMFNIVERAKYDAWAELKGMSSVDAKRTFIASVNKSAPGWRESARSPKASSPADTTTPTFSG